MAGRPQAWPRRRRSPAGSSSMRVVLCGHLLPGAAARRAGCGAEQRLSCPYRLFALLDQADTFGD